MHILVVGGAGYIGSHTVKALRQAGHDVTSFDSLERGHAASLKGLIPPDRQFNGNILNQTDLDRVFAACRYDGVIHFAAYAEVGESAKEPGKYFWNNTAGTVSLINAMLAHEVHRLVFSSTCAIYGQPDEVPIKETTGKHPESAYGRSKFLVEQLLEDMTALTPLRAAALRYFNACGADPDGTIGEDHQPESHLIPLVLQVALGQRDGIKIFGTDYPTPDGTAIRDYVHVTDLAAAHILALESMDDTEGKLRQFNLGTGHGYSVKEVIETARQVTGHPIPADPAPRRTGDPAKLIADATLATTGLRWQPQHSDLKTVVETAWKWHQAHPHGYER